MTAAQTQTTDAPQAEAPVHMPTGSPTGQMGIVLETFDDFWRFATIAVKGRWAPDGMSIEGAVLAMQKGAELGIAPVTAMQNIAVINGRPTVWGDVLLAICKKSPLFVHASFKEWWSGTEAGEDLTAHCQAQRTGAPIEESTFSLVDAQSQGRIKGKHDHLLAKWVSIGLPVKRMLQMRARAFRLRDTFPDVTSGLYSREEMMATEAVDALDLSGDVKPPPTAREIAADLEKTNPLPPPGPEPQEPPEKPVATPQDAPTTPPDEPADARRKKQKAADLVAIGARVRAKYAALTAEQRQTLDLSTGIGVIAAWTENDILDLEILIGEAAGGVNPSGN